MTVFWIIAMVLTIAALIFVLPALLVERRDHGCNETSPSELNVSVYQDQFAELKSDLRSQLITQEQYEQGRNELERRMIQDIASGDTDTSAAKTVIRRGRWVAVVIAVALPLSAFGLYYRLGNPGAISPGPAAAASSAGHPQSTVDISRLAEDLAAKLKKNPQDLEGWVLLARSYMALSRFQEAADAFAKATDRVDADAQLLADYADALAMSSGKASLVGKPIRLIRQALEIDPNNQKALWLAGTAAYESGNYQAALSAWKRLARLLPPDSPNIETINGNIREVQGLLDSSAVAASSGAAAPEGNTAPVDSASATSAGVSGTVKIAPEKAGKLVPTDSIFVFARAVQGPRVPLAVLRVQVKDLPFSFTLDDSMAVMPMRKISDARQVIVGARISKSGSATPEPGDLEGFSTPVPLGSNGVEVVINQVVP